MPTNVIRNISDGEITTDIKAPSMLFCHINNNVTNSPRICPIMLIIIKNLYLENPFINEKQNMFLRSK